MFENNKNRRKDWSSIFSTTSNNNVTTIEQAKKIVQTIVLEEMEKDLAWQALACTWLLFRIPIADFYEYTKTTFLDFLTLFPSFCIYTTFTRYDKKYSSTNTFNIFLKKKKEKRNNNQRRYKIQRQEDLHEQFLILPPGNSTRLFSIIFINFSFEQVGPMGHQPFPFPPPPLFFHRFPPRQDSFASRFPDTWSIAVIYDLVKNGENHLFSRDMIYEGSREESRGGEEEGGMDGNGGWIFSQVGVERRATGIDHFASVPCHNFIA